MLVQEGYDSSIEAQVGEQQVCGVTQRSPNTPRRADPAETTRYVSSSFQQALIYQV